MKYIASIIALAVTSVAWAEKPSQVEVVNLNPIPVAVVDEPGFSPYQVEVDFAPSTCTTTAFCIVEFPAVPADKRLVVEEITILAGVGGGGVPNFVAFGENFTTNTNNRFIVQADFSAGPELLGSVFYSMNRSVRVYYEPGETPKVKLAASTNFAFVGNATLHGHLIDATN